MKRVVAALASVLVAAVVAAGAVVYHGLAHWSDGLHFDASRPQPSANDIISTLLPRPGSLPATGHPWVLVVGNSIPAGLTLRPEMIGRMSAWPTALEANLGHDWHVATVACPGVTTSSYFAQCPYSYLEPWLHGRSLASAAHQLIAAHGADLRAIVVEIADNDLFVDRRDHVGLQRGLVTLEAGVDRVLGDLQEAAPSVPLVVANMYDPYPRADVQALVGIPQGNRVIDEVAASRHAVVADVHAAVDGEDGAVVDANVDTVDGDIHPTAEGHRRIAAAVMSALAVAGVIPAAERPR